MAKADKSDQSHKCGRASQFDTVITVGLISDTHGLLRPEAMHALQGSDFIVHAGDIGKAVIIDELTDIAPVTAVRGNVDRDECARLYNYDEVLQVAGLDLYVLHIIDDIKIDPAAANFSAVIYGHSHKPWIEEKAGVVYCNPGSAGPRRFSLPVTVGKLKIREGGIEAEIIDLGI